MYIVCIIEMFQYVHHETTAVYGFNNMESQKVVNKKAEDIFTSMIKEIDPDISETNIEVAIEDGYIEIGKTEFILTHPEIIEV
ncbi:MAG: hypothetical protein ABIF11_11665 [Nitrospirota bacterium]